MTATASPSPAVAPPTPDALASFGEPSPRVRVRDALRRLMAAPDWARATWTVRQNRLLDEVGSDLRPLVALLMRAGEGGVADGLPATRAGWPAVRGALVVSLTAHSFLMPEMARWAVECWGYAVGVADEAELTAAADPRVPLWAEAERRAAAAREAAARAARAAAPPAVGHPQTTVGGGGAAPTPVPRPAGVPAAGRAPAATPAPPQVVYATRPLATSPPVPRGPARRRGRLPEGFDNPVARVSLAGICGFAAYVLYSAVRLPSARATEFAPAFTVASALPAVDAGPTVAPSAPGIPGVTSNGLPQTAEDSARMIRVSPARRPTYALELGPSTGAVARPGMAGPSAGAAPGSAPGTAPGSAPGPAPGPARPIAGPPAPPASAPATAPVAPAVAPALPSSPDGYDRLRLRDGRVLRGRVELVRVGSVVFRDADTGLRYEHPKPDVDAVVTEFGTTVRFSPAEGGTAGSAVGGPRASAAERAAARLVRRGVGGRYQVTFSLVSVAGSPECQRGWRTAPPPDWARVTHVPGADTLAVAFEGGATFASVIDGEAQFASTFVIVPDQAYSGQALTTRLNGRFAEGGFEAAVNLVGYRRVRDGRDVACHTVLRAVGRRAGA